MSEAPTKPGPQELQALAAKATPGPWGFARADRSSGLEPEIVVLRDGSATGPGIARGISYPIRTRGELLDPDAQVYKNARLIAACSPERVQALAELWEGAQVVKAEHAQDIGSWCTCPVCAALKKLEELP